jgi:hypothetical protein
MERKKAIKLGGFAGALCASAALVGISVSGTGAYFTDSQPGSINAGTGHVVVSTSNLSLDFNNLLPGDYQTKDVNYTAHGTGAEDVWLVFPTDGSAEALTGRPDDAAGGGLGRYGHFAVSSTNGASFTSYNLSRNRLNDNSAPCPVDANGEGGSNQVATDRSDYSLPYCAPQDAILLASNLTNGQGGTATFTFGFTPLFRSPQDAPTALLAKFNIVATQHGVRPDNANN